MNSENHIIFFAIERKRRAQVVPPGVLSEARDNGIRERRIRTTFYKRIQYFPSSRETSRRGSEVRVTRIRGLREKLDERSRLPTYHPRSALSNWPRARETRCGGYYLSFYPSFLISTTIDSPHPRLLT